MPRSCLDIFNHHKRDNLIHHHSGGRPAIIALLSSHRATLLPHCQLETRQAAHAKAWTAFSKQEVDVTGVVSRGSWETGDSSETPSGEIILLLSDHGEAIRYVLGHLL